MNLGSKNRRAALVAALVAFVGCNHFATDFSRGFNHDHELLKGAHRGGELTPEQAQCVEEHAHAPGPHSNAEQTSSWQRTSTLRATFKGR